MKTKFQMSAAQKRAFDDDRPSLLFDGWRWPIGQKGRAMVLAHRLIGRARKERGDETHLQCVHPEFDGSGDFGEIFCGHIHLCI